MSIQCCEINFWINHHPDEHLSQNFGKSPMFDFFSHLHLINASTGSNTISSNLSELLIRTVLVLFSILCASAVSNAQSVSGSHPLNITQLWSVRSQCILVLGSWIFLCRFQNGMALYGIFFWTSAICPSWRKKIYLTYKTSLGLVCTSQAWYQKITHKKIT